MDSDLSNDLNIIKNHIIPSFPITDQIIKQLLYEKHPSTDPVYIDAWFEKNKLNRNSSSH